MKMKIDLADKTALVTASSKGIGFGIARALFESGAKLCICARDEERVRSAAQTLAGEDASRILPLAGNLGNAAFLSQMVERCVKHFGSGIDILVNNSGGPPPGEALSITEEQWMEAVNGNLMSVIRLSALVVPGMKTKGWGRIINLTSTAAKEPGAGMVLSNVTRAGVAAYSKTLAQELGPFGITVNTILTGGVLTDRLRSLLERNIQQTGESFEDAMARIEKTIPVRHLATPDEFAQTVLFLASPEAGYLTGTAIPLDGGTSKSIF
jgi:3-oxoacyl-[acyl-carrier protein] reductase